MKNDPYAPQMNNSFGYGTPNNQTNYPYNNGGMGVLNYNAYSQKEYDELKQEFFRPPPARQDHYSKIQ